MIFCTFPSSPNCSSKYENCEGNSSREIPLFVANHNPFCVSTFMDKTKLFCKPDDLLIIELGDFRKSIGKGRVIHDERLTWAVQLIHHLNDTGLVNKFPIKTVNGRLIIRLFYLMEF